MVISVPIKISLLGTVELSNFDFLNQTSLQNIPRKTQMKEVLKALCQGFKQEETVS